MKQLLFRISTITFLFPFFCFAEFPSRVPLDGISIEALETYQNPNDTNIGVTIGWWPADPYYNGFSFDLGYTKYFGKTFGWEVLHLDYIYSVAKGLTSELAENYGVQPNEKIERMSFIISSDLEYIFAYGKFVIAKNYIRYFRSSVLLGPAYVSTNKHQIVGLSTGLKFEILVNSSFSWKAELRDIYAFANIGNNLSFMFGTVYGF